MKTTWDRESILKLARSFQEPCVLAAAVDLDVFTLLAAGPLDAREAAGRLDADFRGVTTLLDALAALGLLQKDDGRYTVPPEVAAVLTKRGDASALGMVRHQSTCLKRWTELPWVAKSGTPAERRPSLRGAEADHAAFIEAMNDISRPVADPLIGELQPPSFSHLLDIGGASGTWTMAWLRARPAARATLFDLPEVIPMAESRLREEGFLDRVTLAPGDYTQDELPAGADLAWLSAIVHQESREENRALYARIFRALAPGGRLLIRDIVMSDDHTRPPGGALFAINMLVATEGGGTFSLSELREDLASAGFAEVEQLREDPWMQSIVSAAKPG